MGFKAAKHLSFSENTKMKRSVKGQMSDSCVSLCLTAREADAK